MGREVQSLWFDELNCDYLHTERGVFHLPPLGTHFASSAESVGYGLNSDCTWVVHNGRKLLWIPPEYQPSTLAVRGNIVAIGCFSGRVMVIAFSDGV